MDGIQLLGHSFVHQQKVESSSCMQAFFFCKQVASCVTPIMTGRSIAAPPVSPSWGDSVLGRQRAGEEKGMNVKPPTQWRRLLPFFPLLPPTSVSQGAPPGSCGSCWGWRGLAVELHMRRQPGRSFLLSSSFVFIWDHHRVTLSDHQLSEVVRSAHIPISGFHRVAAARSSPKSFHNSFLGQHS